MTLRRRVLLAAWLAAGLGLVARAAVVQVVQGDEWEGIAERQHRRSLEIPAARGSILDRDGTPLAVSHERIRVSVAPGEVADGEATADALVRALDLDRRRAERIVASSDPWVVLPGRYPPAVRETLAPLRGVYLEPVLERLRPHGDLAAGALGRTVEGRGAGGIEQAFDTLLAGRPGREIQARDHVGQPIPGESYLVQAPRAGGEVVLTLDLDLQEIGREALARAVDETGARGGDLLITDPRSGEILTMVSLREDGGSALTAIHSPYEPGSTLKPFTVAGLLARDLVSLRDTVDAEGGRWRAAGRTLADVEPHDRISVGDALRVSSNIGIAKAASAYTPAQQYETLRDFGFGVPTGIELAGEASGTLRRPERWSRQSPVSLAIGYEVSVTPIQMAMAYGALANGGWLMEPRLVREVRGPDGARVESSSPRRVRRVIPEGVARRIGSALVDVVEDGTGTAARLSTFRVAGKSGTSRAYATDGGYEEGGYFASFVGFFPADDPQLVVFVKLDRPEGTYYGGATAAPVTRATLEAILAARRAPLDRSALVSLARRVDAPGTVRSARLASRAVRATTDPGEARRLTVASAADAGPVERVEGRRVEPRPVPSGAATEAVGPVPVPDVSGLPLRVAVRRLHSLGLRVRWDGAGTAGVTEPPAGARVEAGDTVRIGGLR